MGIVGNLQAEAARQVAAAIQHWSMSETTIDEANPTIITAVLRSPNTSQVFTATIQVTNAKEV